MKKIYKNQKSVKRSVCKRCILKMVLAEQMERNPQSTRFNDNVVSVRQAYLETGKCCGAVCASKEAASKS